MTRVSTLRRALDGLTTLMMVLGEISVVAMMLLVTADVVLRYVFGVVIDASAEVVTHYLMVAIIYFALGDITRNEGHLTATFFTDWMSSRAKARIEGVVALILGLFMVLLTWQVGVSAWEATKTGEILQAARVNVLIWPSRWILVAGSVTMALYSLGIGIGKLRGRIPAKGADLLQA